MAAWFALTENRYEDVIEASEIGLQVKSDGSVGVQLHLQEAKAYARLTDASETERALKEAAGILGKSRHPPNTLTITSFLITLSGCITRRQFIHRLEKIVKQKSTPPKL